MTKRSTYFRFNSQRATGGGIVVVKEIWNGLGKVGAKDIARYLSNAQRGFRPLSKESVC